MKEKHRGEDNLINALADTLSVHDNGSVFSTQYLRQITRKRITDLQELQLLPSDAVNRVDNTGVTRRDFLKMLGLITVSGTVSVIAFDRIIDNETLTGLQVSEECGYRTVEISSGETRSFSADPTLENTVFDVTASGAEVHLSAIGNGWEVRNIGIRGPQHDKGDTSLLSMRGNGLIENFYSGEGCSLHGTRKVGFIANSNHGGHIDIRNLHLQGISSNGIYAAGFGRIRGPGKTDGAGGTVAVENSYFLNNNVAHLRLAADGTTVENCVFHNTNKVPALETSVGGGSDVVNSRGIYTGYGDPQQVIEVRNCHFDITAENTCTENDYGSCAASAAYSGEHRTYGECSIVRFIDCEIRGRLGGSQIETQNIGDNPSHTPPDGVPMSAEEAACGQSSASGTRSTAGDIGNTVGSNPC